MVAAPHIAALGGAPRPDGKVVFIDGALPGELVSANVNQPSVVIMRDPELMNTLLRLQLAPGFYGPASGSPPDTFNVSVSLNVLRTSKPEDQAGRQLISTNVNVALGETVVVGTSRLGGGRKAYVLVLTAIAK